MRLIQLHNKFRILANARGFGLGRLALDTLDTLASQWI